MLYYMYALVAAEFCDSIVIHNHKHNPPIIYIWKGDVSTSNQREKDCRSAKFCWSILDYVGYLEVNSSE